MKINDVNSAKGAAPARRKKTGDGSGNFADALRDAAGTGDSAPVVDSAPVHAVDAVLAIQETDDATDRRSRGLVRQYGETLLDKLDSIRHDLLMGAVPKSKLAELAQSMRAQRARCNDPQLTALIDEIELRCEVEIAKLTR